MVDREDARLAAQMAGEFLGLLSVLNNEQSAVPQGTPEPPEVAEFARRMDETAAEIKARREQNDTET